MMVNHPLAWACGIAVVAILVAVVALEGDRWIESWRRP